MKGLHQPRLELVDAGPSRAGKVLVIGAGPAGSAAARALALAGRCVTLVDALPIGRDKVCGDGLIPDAHQALARLGLLEAVMARAQRAQAVGCVGPRGGRIEVPGSLAVLPRQQLDELLARAAVEAGAQFLQARFEVPLLDERGQVVGVRLRQGAQELELRAPWTLLATGAQPKALQAAGLCTRHTPSGVALRGYLRAPSLVGQIRALEVVWNQAVRPGYGWIFPAPGGVFNIGVGVTDSHSLVSAPQAGAPYLGRSGQGPNGKGQKKDVNLRAIFDAFVAAYPSAQRLLAEGEWVGELKGAPLRCSLRGAQFSRPGLMVVGEAAGSTYSFTGEGIGKAMQTALLAADAILAGASNEAATRAQYEAGLAALAPRYRLYERANRVNAFPWLADLLIWRAQRSPRLLQRMSGVLEETSNPGHLVSLKGLARLFFE